MFKHPVLQKYEFPKDPNDIIKAIQLSNMTDLKLKDTRYLMSLLTRMGMVHDAIPRHLLRRKSLIASSDFDIVPLTEQYTELASQAKLRLENIILDIFDTYVNGYYYGVALTKLIYEDSEIGFIPELDYHFDPVEIEKDLESFNSVTLLQDADTYQFTRVPLNEAERHLYISYVDNNSEAGGIARSIIFKVFLINMSTQEWATFLQFMKGVIQAKVQTGASAEDKQAAANAVQSAVDNKFTVTSQMVDFAFHEIASKDSGNNFDKFISMLKEDIEIAITGTSALASDRERNAPTVQERNEENLARWSRRDFEKLINKQLLKHDYYMNVNKSVWGLPLPYKFVFKPNLAVDKKTNHDMFMDLLDRNVNIAKTDYEKMTGLKLAIDGEEAMNSQIFNPSLPNG